MFPLLFDRSLQAQFLIPVAASLVFGILFATAITLYLIPAAQVAAEENKAPPASRMDLVLVAGAARGTDLGTRPPRGNINLSRKVKYFAG